MLSIATCNSLFSQTKCKSLVTQLAGDYESSVNVKDLSASWSDTPVLEGISFEVNKVWNHIHTMYT